jgi:hypothetical protein
MLGLWIPLALAATAQMATAAGGAAPFDTLLGSWGGSGSFKLQDGKTVRIKCDAYYTGGGAQLGMVVRCTGESEKIEIRSKLSSSGDRLTGSWEERTYNAEGAVSGEATGNRLTVKISGAVSGSMTVSFSSSQQDVAILTQGIPLKSVNVSLSRK